MEISLLALFGIYFCLIFAQGLFGEVAFGGLGIFGPYSPPIRPVDVTTACLFFLTFTASIAVYFWMVLKSFKCELGWPGIPLVAQILPTGIQYVMCFFMSWSYLWILSILPAGGEDPDQALLNICLVALFYTFPVSFAMIGNTRGILTGGGFVCGLIPSYLPQNAGTFGVFLCAFWSSELMGWLCFYTRHVRDQRIMFSLQQAANWFVVLGSTVAKLFIPGQLFTQDDVLICVTIVVVVSASQYALVVYSRFERRFPAGLANCKFVRLGYLRKMLYEGKSIVRCQELPPEAFGDPKKAALVIVTSHRWLNRYTCDIPTEEKPAGLRLTTMVEKLNEHFPCDLKNVSIRTFPRWLWRSLQSQYYGENDCLVFFDFMCLPQMGISKVDGSIVDRTKEEAAIFFEALPAMGTLYTFCDVIVLDEVTPGVHPYRDSGWCFSELCSALLTRRLSWLSPDVKSSAGTFFEEQSRASVVPNSADATNNLNSTAEGVNLVTNTVTTEDDGHEELEANHINLVADLCDEAFMLTEENLPLVLRLFESNLASKKFFNEADRVVVGNIIRGFVILRQLRDAIVSGTTDLVQNLLVQVKDAGLESYLNHGTDPNFNTVLHVAVQHGRTDLVPILISAGVDPSVRNVRGDLATELFMWPRQSPAAARCRQIMTENETVLQHKEDYASVPLSAGHAVD